MTGVLSCGGVGLTADGAMAWPGDPHGSFGACGTKAFDVVAGTPSGARAAALDSAGRVLIAGWADDHGLVMRLDGGELDSTFGTAGRTRVKLTGTTRYEAVAPTVVGGVIAAGRRTGSDGVDSTVLRLRPNGTLDPTFNGDGKLSFNVSGDDAASAVVAVTDGGILVGGDAAGGGYVSSYTNGGAPDSTWAGDGRRAGLPMNIRGLARRADGAVYVGGSTTASPADWRIMRLNPDGSTDDTFGGANGLTVDVGGDDAVTAVVLQPDGALVATGFGNGAAGHGQTVVRRYLANGSVDPAFTPFREAFGVSDIPVAITRQSDGGIVVAGNSKVGGDNDIVMIRLRDDGVPDDGFGIDGATVMDAGARSVVAGVVAPDGGALAVGTVRRSGRDVVGTFRLQADTSTAKPPAQGVVVDAFGGIHGWSAGCITKPSGFVGAPYWLGWDIVRGIAILPGNRGLVVDGYGGAHAFTFGDAASSTRPVIRGTPYWLGWDIVRGVAVVPEGTGGYELDGFGGVHPFSIGSGPKPPLLTGTPYWLGQDRARGIALMPDGGGGYIVDATGRIYRFGGAPAPNAGGPSWPGQDIVRGIALAPDGSGGWLVDRSGGVHPFGTGGDVAPANPVGGPYWLGWDIVRGVAVLP